MANCYCCGNKNASFRRTVSTGYSVGNWGGNRTYGTSSRLYYGTKNVCEKCAKRIDKKNAINRILFLLFIALLIGLLYLYIEKEKSVKHNLLNESKSKKSEQVYKVCLVSSYKIDFGYECKHKKYSPFTY